MNHIDFLSSTASKVFNTKKSSGTITPMTSLWSSCIFQSSQLYIVFLLMTIIPVYWVASRMARTTILETYVWNGVELFPTKLYLLHNAGSTHQTVFFSMWPHQWLVQCYQHCTIFILNNSVDETQNLTCIAVSFLTLLPNFHSIQFPDLSWMWLLQAVVHMNCTCNRYCLCHSGPLYIYLR